MKTDKNYKVIREYDKVIYNGVTCTAYYTTDYGTITLLNENQEVELETDDITIDCELVEVDRDDDTGSLIWNL